MDFKNDLKTYFLEAEYLTSDNQDYGITLNRIIQSMSVRGGKIILGCNDYKINTPVIINKNITIEGAGAADFYCLNWLSAFYTTSNIEMFVVNKVCKISITDTHFFNSSTTLPTGGCAIRVKGVDGTNDLSKIVMNTQITRCTFNKFYDNVIMDGACQWNISNSQFHNAVRYNLVVDCLQWGDAGDSSITSCDFDSKDTLRNTIAHIYQKGGGGLKISQCKFNEVADYCYLGAINAITVILLISNNSFENYRISAVKLTKTSSIFRHVNISNCEFDSYRSGIKDIDIRAGIEHINIIGNSFSSGNTNANNTAINLNSVNQVRLMNTYSGYSNPINAYNCNDVKEAMLQAIPQGNNI